MINKRYRINPVIARRLNLKINKTNRYRINKEKEEDKANFDKEISKRWTADSSAPITRLTRPFLVLFTTFAVFIFGALDSSLEGFEIGDAYLEMYKEVWIVMIVAYFGSRGFEKVKGKG